MSGFSDHPMWTRLCAIVAFLATALLGQPAGAVTTATVEGQTIVIHVPIDVRGLRGAKITDIATGERFDAASYIERAVERIWNEAFAGFTYECWKFRLDLELFPISFEDESVPGHHLVEMDMKRAHSHWDATGPDDMEPSRDFPFAYSRDMTGVFNTPDPAVLAHEIGHALGLGDDYLGRNVFKPEAGGIADRAGGVEFVDADGNAVQAGSFMTRGIGRPEPVHLYRVVKMMREAGVLPPCLPAYVWVGRVEVDNVFAGRTLAMDVHGRHKWRGVYEVKFLERWTQYPSSVSGLSGESFPLNEVVPLEVNYTIRADHHHDYDHKWGDVILRGQAAGKLTRGALKDALIGSVLRFEAAPPARDSARPAPSGSFASWREFQDFMAGFHTAPRPGCYQLSIAFGGKGQPPHEVRALYQGIDRSGSSPIHPGPDADFLRVMPSHMPDGTNVLGCLDTPEQRDVKGEYTYPFADPGPLNSTEQISIRWSFVRTLCRDAATCWSTPENASAPSNSGEGQTSGPPSGAATSDPIAGAAIVAPAATPPNVPMPNKARGAGSGFLRP